MQLLWKERDKLIEHKHYICEHGDDMPEIAGWRWGQAGGARVSDTAGIMSDSIH